MYRKTNCCVAEADHFKIGSPILEKKFLLTLEAEHITNCLPNLDKKSQCLLA